MILIFYKNKNIKIKYLQLIQNNKTYLRNNFLNFIISNKFLFINQKINIKNNAYFSTNY